MKHKLKLSELEVLHANLDNLLLNFIQLKDTSLYYDIEKDAYFIEGYTKEDELLTLPLHKAFKTSRPTSLKAIEFMFSKRMWVATMKSDKFAFYEPDWAWLKKNLAPISSELTETILNRLEKFSASACKHSCNYFLKELAFSNQLTMSHIISVMAKATMKNPHLLAIRDRKVKTTELLLSYFNSNVSIQEQQ